MQRIGIYGGSFNPVHFGHVGLAKWVIENTDLDELWLMVSPLNPLKANAPTSNSASDLTSNFQQRLAAVKKAVKDIPGVKVSDFEFSLPRPSYTANTLRALRQAYPGVEFTLVIGEDNIAIFDRWREYEYILANFRIFVYPRTSSRQTEGAASAEEDYKNLFPGVAVKELRFLTAAPLFNISSTEIRAEMSRISPQPFGS
ncbi:MAG: nicotinate (nicotinamide) nucleotide adenylyltransferase [Paludibacteraceae bacterium]|nr:nicotinate (nicotinamide) nucleotide adenylyltransferase [Paludibacteraceae bacterium]